MNPDFSPTPREELEAKITALLLGELSAEDAATLQKQIAGDVELTRLQDRLRVTLDLVRETATFPVMEPGAQPMPLKLPPAKREALLAQFKTVAPKEFERPQKPNVSWLVPLAAAAMVALLIAISFPRMASRAKQHVAFADLEPQLRGGSPVRSPALVRGEDRDGARAKDESVPATRAWEYDSKMVFSDEKQEVARADAQRPARGEARKTPETPPSATPTSIYLPKYDGSPIASSTPPAAGSFVPAAQGFARADTASYEAKLVQPTGTSTPPSAGYAPNGQIAPITYTIDPQTGKVVYITDEVKAKHIAEALAASDAAPSAIDPGVLAKLRAARETTAQPGFDFADTAPMGRMVAGGEVNVAPVRSLNPSQLSRDLVTTTPADASFPQDRGAARLGFSWNLNAPTQKENENKTLAGLAAADLGEAAGEQLGRTNRFVARFAMPSPAGSLVSEQAVPPPVTTAPASDTVTVANGTTLTIPLKNANASNIAHELNDLFAVPTNNGVGAFNPFGGRGGGGRAGAAAFFGGGMGGGTAAEDARENPSQVRAIADAVTGVVTVAGSKEQVAQVQATTQESDAPDARQMHRFTYQAVTAEAMDLQGTLKDLFAGSNGRAADGNGASADSWQQRADQSGQLSWGDANHAGDYGVTKSDINNAGTVTLGDKAAYFAFATKDASTATGLTGANGPADSPGAAHLDSPKQLGLGYETGDAMRFTNSGKIEAQPGFVIAGTELARFKSSDYTVRSVTNSGTIRGLGFDLAKTQLGDASDSIQAGKGIATSAAVNAIAGRTNGVIGGVYSLNAVGYIDVTGGTNISARLDQFNTTNVNMGLANKKLAQDGSLNANGGTQFQLTKDTSGRTTSTSTSQNGLTMRAQQAVQQNTVSTSGATGGGGGFGPGADRAPVKPAVPLPVPQPETATRSNAFSTFSLNVSDVAFKLAAASLQNGVMPDPAAMRSEEFINAFDYRDPEPAPGAALAFAAERSTYPFAHNRDLLRFSVKTAAAGRSAGRPLNLVLLLDKSGSMERADRVAIVRQALTVLAGQLQAQDTLSVVTFARTPRLFVDGVSGTNAEAVADELSDLTPEGGTNLEEAMKLAYETALRHYLANGENRVVLLTDGAANLGEVEPTTLKQKVETNRQQGIAFDCFGIGWEDYNDTLLETLSRKGGGRYGFINTPQEADTEFAGQLVGALRVAASDVKVQVEFNPDRVTSYRQIGYAKDQLKKEEFRDNTVKAAQIGAAESGNAHYAVEVNPAGAGPLATVHVRYRVPGTSDYQEREWTVPYSGPAVELADASPAMRLAATACGFSEWLAASPFAAEVTPDRLLGYINGVPAVYGADGRPAKLEWMIRQAKSAAGKGFAH